MAQRDLRKICRKKLWAVLACLLSSRLRQSGGGIARGGAEFFASAMEAERPFLRLPRGRKDFFPVDPKKVARAVGKRRRD
jgi:hypothetical protein